VKRVVTRNAKIILISIAVVMGLVIIPPHNPVGAEPAHDKSIARNFQPAPMDPMSLEPANVQDAFACIAYVESRDKIVDTNPVSNAQGIYQFLPYIWQYARNYIAGLPATPNQASLVQQETVALFYYHRNGGLYPEWTDGCSD
jgi:hypothetical protein